MDKVIEMQGDEIHIADDAAEAVRNIGFARLPEFAKQARKDAEDYAEMAKQHEARAAHFTKLSQQRVSDAEYYERKIADEGRQEAAE